MMELWMALAAAFLCAFIGALCARAAKKRESRSLLIASLVMAAGCLCFIAYTVIALAFFGS